MIIYDIDYMICNNLNKDTTKDFVKDSGKLPFLESGKSYEDMLLLERKWTHKIASNEIPPQFSISPGFQKAAIVN